jgi:hypothetical protein
MYLLVVHSCFYEPHELKNRDKIRAKKKGKTKGDKNQIEKGAKAIKH